MSPKSCKTFPEMMELLSKHRPDFEKDDSLFKYDADDDDMSDLDEFEEVFADHLLMEQRLRKRLYAGDFSDLKELPEHPPIALTGLALELFSKAVPNYGLDILDMDYVASASEAARISPCAMILAMIYLERLQLNNSEYLETASPSGLFVVTMLVASKFLFEDDGDMVTNQMWAEALNLDVKDLNRLEYEFLSAIDWKVFIDSPAFFHYLSDVERVVAFKESACRGWLSFSDICVIAEHNVFYGFWSCLVKRIAKMTLLSALGYVATAFALHGSGIALQKYMKPAKCSPQNLTKDTTNLTSTIHSSIQPVDESALLQPALDIIDQQISESNSITYKVTIIEQERSESFKDDTVTQQLCHPYNKFKIIPRSIGHPHVLNDHSTHSAYLSYNEELAKPNYTFSHSSWNQTQYGGQNLCIFLRVKQCY